MSSSEMPLTTREPVNGGTKIALSVLDLGRPGGQRRRGRLVALGDARPRGRHARTRTARGPSRDRRRLGRRVDLAEAVHHPQALEGVLAVEQPALVHVAQVALDVGAGERGAAEQHRDVGQARGRSAPRGCRA